MLDTAVVGVDFWAMNTDAQALGRSKVRGANVLNIGSGVTRGLGAGGDPNVGRMAAEESRNDIKKVVEGCDMCFVTSGMGGGTGSGEFVCLFLSLASYVFVSAKSKAKQEESGLKESTPVLKKLNNFQ